MSTKIYTGFKFNGTVRAFLKTVEKFRPCVIAGGEMLMDAFMQHTINTNTKPEMTDEEKNGVRADAYMAWLDRKRNIKTTGLRDPITDLDFTIVIYPQRANLLYGQVFTEHHGWFDEWLKMPRVESFGYWNNTDPEEGFTDEQWQERGKIWDRIFKTYPVPSMVGLSIDVHDPQGPFPKAWRTK